MSIRLRRIVGNQWVALCAARSVAQPGDIYLDDGHHAALTAKFSEDFNSEGCWPLAENEQANRLRAREESNNPNRTWWDATYGHEKETPHAV